MKKCEHSRQQHYCKECKALGIGGSQICDHNIRRSRCKICDGSENKKCEHNRYRYQCKECKALGIGGSQICEHDILRSGCKECKALGTGGASICEHNRRRYACKDCGGSQTRKEHSCEHKRSKYDCRICATTLCEHQRLKRICFICKPGYRYAGYRHDATKKGLSFSINLEQFISITSLPCDLCGEHTEPRGIDRWDNDIGYEFENCRPCCKVCNFLKRAKDGPTFVDHVQRMAAHTLAVENADCHAAFEAHNNF